MRIAVVGTGISGNVAAHYLHQQHDVVVYESANYIGGHTHTHDVLWSGQHYAIDTGFIVFNDWTYPNFEKLLIELGVQSMPTEMSFSVKDVKTRLEYNGHSLNTLFAQRRNLVRPSFYRLLRDVVAFNRASLTLLEEQDSDLTMGEYLAQSDYSEWFKSAYILPMGAAIWSTDAQRMLQFPARFFVQFFKNHGLLSVNDRPQWYVIKGGSREYVRQLVSPFRNQIRLNTRVRSIRRFPDRVLVEDVHGQSEGFDAVFIATHSDQALRMLEQPSDAEKSILRSIRYQQNEAVLHTDTDILPRRRKAWAAWNYHKGPQAESNLAVTYNMNVLQHLDAPVTFCVTLNPGSLVKRHKVIDRLTYDHPLFTPDSVAAQARLPEINGVNRTYYCGAYWANGFHEDGVVSAQTAVKLFKKTNYVQQNLLRAS